MTPVRKGFSNCEIGRNIGRPEAAVRRVEKAVLASSPRENDRLWARKDARIYNLVRRQVKKDWFITAKALKGLHAS